jgi:hypothetical protein
VDRVGIQAWPPLPAMLRSPIPVTNVGAYGLSLDTATSPASLIAAQAHLGHLAFLSRLVGFLGKVDRARR